MTEEQRSRRMGSYIGLAMTKASGMASLALCLLRSTPTLRGD